MRFERHTRLFGSASLEDIAAAGVDDLEESLLPLRPCDEQRLLVLYQQLVTDYARTHWPIDTVTFREKIADIVRKIQDAAQMTRRLDQLQQQLIERRS